MKRTSKKLKLKDQREVYNKNRESVPPKFPISKIKFARLASDTESSVFYSEQSDAPVGTDPENAYSDPQNGNKSDSSALSSKYYNTDGCEGGYVDVEGETYELCKGAGSHCDGNLDCVAKVLQIARTEDMIYHVLASATGIMKRKRAEGN